MTRSDNLPPDVSSIPEPSERDAWYYEYNKAMRDGLSEDEAIQIADHHVDCIYNNDFALVGREEDLVIERDDQETQTTEEHR